MDIWSMVLTPIPLTILSSTISVDQPRRQTSAQRKGSRATIRTIEDSVTTMDNVVELGAAPVQDVELDSTDLPRTETLTFYIRNVRKTYLRSAGAS